MSVKRVLKLMTASLAGQGVSIINQLLVPPLFFHRYDHGIERYGEWIAPSAAISYLNTVNGGIQNYANNQMTIHYNRGEVYCPSGAGKCSYSESHPVRNHRSR